MPNTREKLIELLDDALLSVNWGSDDYPYTDDAADILIANGVTVQKWIPVSERLPENAGRYLTAIIRANDERDVFDLWFDCGEWYIDENDDEFIHKVTHWMPLPEPPKGE